MSISLSDITHCLCVRKGGRLVVVDGIHPNTGRGVYGNRSEGDDYEGQPLIKMELDEAAEEAERGFLSDPIPVTEEEAEDMRDCLPPARYSAQYDGFAVGEATYGNIHAHYMRKNGQWFHMRQPITTPWADLFASIK